MKPDRDPYFEAWVHVFRAVIRLRRRLSPRPMPSAAPHRGR